MRYWMIVICSIMYVTLSAQREVRWMSFEEAIAQQQIKPKKVFVSMYTDWCKWCKLMDKTTFSDPLIAEYINNNFYPVRFNAETKKDITFQGKRYRFITNGKNKSYHELAAFLSRNRLSYPTMIFLDETGEVIQPLPGYQDPKSFEVHMTFIAGNFYKKIPWGKYQNSFESSY